MKLTLWKGKAPATSPARTVAGLQETYAAKLGALRKATGRPERFLSHCACALHDRPFVVVYERTNPAKPFTIAGIYKDGAKANLDTGKDCLHALPVAGHRRSVPASEIDTAGWRCPHCGCAARVIACDSCGTTICGGRMVRAPGIDDVFNCRPSCGARGTLTDAAVIHGSDGARKAAPALRSPSTPAPALPSSDRLRLKAPK
jgi:hypothetical protein